MSVSRQELQQWRAELKAGNNRFLTVLFERYGAHCLRTLRKQTGCSQPDAEDILQDAILVFRVNILTGKVTHAQNLQGYLYTICRNLQRSQAEQQSRQLDYQEEAARRMYDERYERPSVDGTDRESDTQRKLSLVWAAFDKLRPGCQRILRRFYLQHQSIAEITQDLHLANDAVTRSTKSQCFRRWMDEVDRLQHKNTVNETNY